jgi:hypothetical protein
MNKRRREMKATGCIRVIIAAGCCAAIFLGCAGVRETVKGIAGTSTKVLEEARPDAVSKTVQHDYNTSYLMTKTILDKIKAYVYAEDTGKRLIAIYVSEEDTTPVGIFFTEINPNSTKIEVSSPSEFAKHFIAGELFSTLK